MISDATIAPLLQQVRTESLKSYLGHFANHLETIVKFVRNAVVIVVPTANTLVLFLKDKLSRPP